MPDYDESDRRSRESIVSVHIRHGRTSTWHDAPGNFDVIEEGPVAALEKKASTGDEAR